MEVSSTTSTGYKIYIAQICKSLIDTGCQSLVGWAFHTVFHLIRCSRVITIISGLGKITIRKHLCKGSYRIVYKTTSTCALY